MVSDGKITQGKHMWFVFREMVLEDKEGLVIQTCGKGIRGIILEGTLNPHA